MKTVEEIANDLGISEDAVRWRCRQLGIPKISGVFFLNEEQEKAVREWKDKRRRYGSVQED